MAQDATIETRIGSGNPAEYGGVDWRAIRIREMGRLGLVCAELFLVVESENYEQILDQENTLIERNQVAPYLDRISIQDERDWSWWVHYRDERPSEEFDELIKLISWVGKNVLTLYPQEDVVEMYEERRLREISEIFDGKIQ